MDPSDDPLAMDALLEQGDIDYETPAQMPTGEADALERASWHLKRAAAKRDELARLKAVYDAEIDRLKIRLGHRTRILQSQIDWHEEPVRQMHLALVDRDPKSAKTIDLPYGTSKVSVPKSPKVEIVDPDAVTAWALDAHPDIVKHSVNVTAVRSVATPAEPSKVTVGKPGKAIDAATGEIIPGVEVTLDEPRWTVSYESETT